VVDRHFASSVPGIYAIGDVIAGPMLAHKAAVARDDSDDDHVAERIAEKMTA
jgi:pyruvate/2-oxoglutarate dehydrogenase complex dihydrolipoamide dehydrogenase (E3) component